MCNLELYMTATALSQKPVISVEDSSKILDRGTIKIDNYVDTDTLTSYGVECLLRLKGVQVTQISQGNTSFHRLCACIIKCKKQW